MQAPDVFFDEIVLPLLSDFRSEPDSLARGFAALSAVQACLNHIVIEKMLADDPAAKLGPRPEAAFRKKLLQGDDYPVKFLRLASALSEKFRHGKSAKDPGLANHSGEFVINDGCGIGAYHTQTPRRGQQIFFESNQPVGENWFADYGLLFRFCSLDRILLEAVNGLEILLDRAAIQRSEFWTK
ncbi:hypothetical protein [Loktanella sp. DSM 29012]|uniref:hypothetical protein n=1 Tax=Loktanella sp. DSM 29012 TaxID=1881056 RepID=UPI00115FEF9C|nr:hypothetical protein [Loktanella sp. DSM 29012]